MDFEFSTSNSYLKRVNKLVDRFQKPEPKTKEGLKRLNKEFRIIQEKGFTECYTQVHEIIKLTKSKGIPHVLRGSAACSLVAYLMGIHDIDPIEHNIPLERFLNWTRSDHPDFDIDYPYNVRDDIIEELQSMYPGRVARISNRVMYREKSALRQACRDFGHTGRLPRWFNLKDIFPDPDTRNKVRERAEELEGTQRMWMRHCGGIVIFDDHIPSNLVLDAEDNQIAADKEDVKENDWIKIDILSNRGLAQLNELDDRKVNEYPKDDEKASQLICEGKNLGLTQAESRTMRRALLAIQPKRMEEVALALALIRPAAAAGGRKFSFLKDYENKGKDQNGIVFDEDAIKFIADVSGCSYSEADRYRRGFSDGDEEVIDEFIKLIDWRDNRQEIIEELYNLQKYSFAKGHALAYGQMVWALAYHKARDPKSFWQSTLEHCHSSYSKWVHMRKAINAGVKLHNSTNGTSLRQFKKDGWWDGEDFLPNMGVKEEDEKTWFRGIFGDFRKHYSYGETSVLGVIGVGNGEFEDVVVSGDYPEGYYRIIEGWGRRRKKLNYSHIDVKDFHCSNVNLTSHRMNRKKFFW